MNGFARVALASALILRVLAVDAVAQVPAKSLKDRLVGHWQLVSVNINGIAPYGANPQGSMFLDAAGHYSIIVITAGEARSISYFGTYTVDEAAGTVTMHIDASNRPGSVGRDQKRLVTFNGDGLVIAGGNSHGPLGAPQLTWKQAN